MSEKESRREVLKRAVYVAPAVMTLVVRPSYASGGSNNLQPRDSEEGYGGRFEGDHGNHGNHGQHKGYSKKKKKKNGGQD